MGGRCHGGVLGTLAQSGVLVCSCFCTSECLGRQWCVTVEGESSGGSGDWNKADNCRVHYKVLKDSHQPVLGCGASRGNGHWNGEPSHDKSLGELEPAGVCGHHQELSPLLTGPLVADWAFFGQTVCVHHG